MAAAPDSKNASGTAREHLARSRALREDMIRSGNAAVYHLRRAAEQLRKRARNGR
jgi:hypothetical protein